MEQRRGSQRLSPLYGRLIHPLQRLQRKAEVISQLGVRRIDLKSGHIGVTRTEQITDVFQGDCLEGGDQGPEVRVRAAAMEAPSRRQWCVCAMMMRDTSPVTAFP